MAIARVLTGFRLFAGEKLNEIINAVNSIQGATGSTPGAGSFSTLKATALMTFAPQIAVAAGSNSQANALPITKSRVVVATVSATTRAVRLPVAATGLEVVIFNAGTTGVKVYPATGDKITTGATNAVGTAIIKNKSVHYYAQDALTWRTLVGA